MKDFDEPGTLAPTGLHLAGTKYMVIQGEGGAVIRGKKVSLFGSSLASSGHSLYKWLMVLLFLFHLFLFLCCHWVIGLVAT